AADVLPYVEADLKKISSRLRKVIMSCSKLTDFAEDELAIQVYRPWQYSYAQNVLCEAAEKHHASMLVVGNHGYGAIKRAVLGSVSDYCAHHAHCTVMIVKKPKIKH
ncbi:hypothetical protein C3L33_07615, partial [Rhododendron williamsianum]